MLPHPNCANFFHFKKNATMPSMRILSAMFHVKVWQGLIFFDAAAIAARTPAGSLVMVAVYGRCADCRSWPSPAHRQKNARAALAARAYLMQNQFS
jgi:hypothetical protein